MFINDYALFQDHPTSPSALMSDNDSEVAGSGRGGRFRGGRRGLDPVTSSPGMYQQKDY
jgi:hypothetical protein